MRRHDKKIHIQKINFLFENRCLNEEIRAEEAYQDWGAMMTVLRGKRDVAFLLGPFVRKWHNKYIKNNNNVNLLLVKRNGSGVYGDAYILYTDKAKAINLHRIMMKHNGYLEDNSPEEAIENGEALEYNSNDIKQFVDRHYGDGAYDKIKTNYYEKVG